jgi:hypothetical protein
MKQHFHPEHFFCAQCGKVFTANDTFLESQGKAYCQEDYSLLFAHLCEKCHQSIVSEHGYVFDAYWHPACLRCYDVSCSKQLNETGFYEIDGHPYCEEHYHAKTLIHCATCKQTITGKVISALGKAYHAHHFVCHFCSKILSTAGFCEKNNHSFCIDCFKKFYG